MAAGPAALTFQSGLSSGAKEINSSRLMPFAPLNAVQVQLCLSATVPKVNGSQSAFVVQRATLPRLTSVLGLDIWTGL